MLSKVLIANRGEVAVRIIATLRRMGIRSVAVASEADATTLPVRLADEAVVIGGAAAAESYLDVDAVIDAALRTGATAVHPGYGFLAERADAAQAIEDAGLVFIGPTPDHLRVFGAKHRAREVAATAGVPLLPASGLLVDVDDARRAAAGVGFPVVLKATSGGGGIGMRVCATEAELVDLFDGARRQAVAAFGDAGLYLERYLIDARHVEVQIVGDGRGLVVTVGDRDCSTQRRNQKVIEEAPAPNLPNAIRAQLHRAALALGEHVSYRSVGTVEFLVDTANDLVAFLEVNTRLQVEHAVTEAVYGIDLVEWMVRLAAGDATMLDRVPAPSGHAIEARLCAENPWRDHQPSTGLITCASFPPGVRVDTWIETGTEVTPHYDPLLAKIVVHGGDRAAAVRGLDNALSRTEVAGLSTNIALVRAVLADERFMSGSMSTGLLATVVPAAPVVEVVTAGTMTTVQDHPGRIGLWPVGVPPSGPIDDLSFRLANRLVANPEGAAALELTATGPALRFHCSAVVAVTGAAAAVTIDGAPAAMGEAVHVTAGSTLAVGAIGPPGLRAYVAIAGGIDVPELLGSRATFTLGRFGGHSGRALRPGDMVPIGALESVGNAGTAVPPAIGSPWELAVHEGPHAAPEFFTPDGIDELYAAMWRVHHNSDRTGIRLIGPRLEWARSDGGDAGLHPSNIHDTAYAVGSVDFTGDMPIILGPDGPSLGGFVCPAVVVSGDRWKLGQLRPGDTVRFVPVSSQDAAQRRAATKSRAGALPLRTTRDAAGGVLGRREADGDRPAVCWRRSGDDHLLVEYGPMTLDLALRFRVDALERWIAAHLTTGVLEVTAGVRSLQVHVDADLLPLDVLVVLLAAAEDDLPPVAAVEVDSRIVHLPLSWDDPSTREAIARYSATVRPDAPWCPWNIEFIRRINGLDDVSDVHRTVFEASYLVLGLGDVYLGAPVAVPLDPRHRLVTTKYNPARTWTPENAVGIGGAYLCVYGMEGPGGYQLIGRTVQMWNRFHRTTEFTKPWLLRPFDRIRFFEVRASELLDWRRDLPVGRASLVIEPGRLRLADQIAFDAAHAESISAFRNRQQQAFAEERSRWEAMGEFDRAVAEPAGAGVDGAGFRPAFEVPEGSVAVEAALSAAVWKVLVEVGDRVEAGDAVVVLEAMKMETSADAPVSGTVTQVLVQPGGEVDAGDALLVIGP